MKLCTSLLWLSCCLDKLWFHLVFSNGLLCVTMEGGFAHPKESCSLPNPKNVVCFKESELYM